MPNIPSDTQLTLRSPCPPASCDCGYYNLVPDASDEFVGPKIQRYQGLTITKMQEKSIAESIKNVTTFEQFNSLRDALRSQHGITFLVQPDGRIKVDTIGGLCRKTRDKVRKSFQEVFAENPTLLITLLNRDSLFSDERE